MSGKSLGCRGRIVNTGPVWNEQRISSVYFILSSVALGELAKV